MPVSVAATQAHTHVYPIYNGKTQEAYFALKDDLHFEYPLCPQVMEPPPLVMAYSNFPYHFHYQGGYLMYHLCFLLQQGHL